MPIWDRTNRRNGSRS